MPGPRNQKKQRGTEAKKSRKKGTSKSLVAASLAYAEVVDIPAVVAVDTPEPVRTHDVSYVALSLDTAYVSIVGPNDASNAAEPTSKCIASHPPRLSPAPPVPPSPPAHDAVPFPAPCIEDPGSGPRVRDAVAFLASPWAIRPATLDEAPLCAELAEEDVLAMVREILPEELAVMVWYNRTRRSSRICLACQRLYTLGDVLPDPFPVEESENGQVARVGKDTPSPQVSREQALSGLCSPVCFALSLFNFSDVVHAVWGASGTGPWRLLVSPTRAPPAVDNGLGLAVRMTRRADLGLGLLLGLSEDNEPEYEDGGWDEWNAVPCPGGDCQNVRLPM